MNLVTEFILLFFGGLLFALGFLLIGNEGFYFWLKQLMGQNDPQPENPAPIWSPQNYGRYMFGAIMIIIGLSLIHIWRVSASA
jgi:hypothetical protein